MDTLPDIGRKPTYGSTIKATTRVIRNEFGEGYSQRAADGMNNINKSVPLTWPALPIADADTLLAFFEAKGGHESFYWTPPWSAVVDIWTAAEWDFTPISSTLKTVTATFKRENDIA